MVDDLVNLLEQQAGIPGFLLDGQTVLLEDYLRIRPGEANRVAKLVADGRISTGPWYVLADEQVPSGESLIRNLLLGATDSRRLGGRMPVLYSPDAFGHPAIMPMLAAEFGLPHGTLWRGVQSERDLFRWKGADGSELLVYHLPPDGYEIGSGLVTEVGGAARAWDAVRRAVVPRAGSEHVAVFVGADHHAARHDLIQLRDTIASLEPEHQVRLSRLEDFLQCAAEAATALPVRTGELRQHGYTWALQGIHATRASQKRRNSRLELWLQRYGEPLTALSPSLPEARDLLASAWRTLVQCHFHDALGGCASDDVAREVDVRLTEVEGVTRELVQRCVQVIWGQDPDLAREQPKDVKPSLLLWNPVPRPREGITLAQVTFFRKDVLVGPPGHRWPRTAPGPEPFALRTSSDQLIQVQVLEKRPGVERLDAMRHYPDADEVEVVQIAFESPSVGGMDGTVLELVPGAEIPQWGGAQARGTWLMNEHIEIEVANDGSLGVLDRGTGVRREAMLRLECESDDGDTYTFSPGPRSVTGLMDVHVRSLASGPLVAALEVSGTMPRPAESSRSGQHISIRLLVMLLRDDPLIRCSLWLDNQADDHRLRARFSTGSNEQRVTAGAQFGAIQRAVVTEHPPVIETPVATAPSHRYAGLGGKPGFAFFAPGFFEYELDAQGDLLFTIMRAVGQLSRHDLPTRPGHAGWPTATPLAQCRGQEIIEFGFAVGEGGWTEPARLHRAWEDLFLPVKGSWYRNWNGHVATPLGFELEGPNLVLTSAKPAESGGGMVVRCCNLGGESVEGVWRLSRAIRRARRIRADETVISELPLQEGGTRVPFTLPPHALGSFLLD
jgi:alpha-mannosidase